MGNIYPSSLALDEQSPYTLPRPSEISNKWEKCEHIGEAMFDIPFMIQSHAESMKKILGAI